MKKTFPFENPPHKPPRVIEGIKHDVRKYLKRERRKPLPEGVDFWDFKCRVGKNAESAELTHVEEIGNVIDRVSNAGWSAIYIEILAEPRKRMAKKKAAPPKG